MEDQKQSNINVSHELKWQLEVDRNFSPKGIISGATDSRGVEKWMETAKEALKSSSNSVSAASNKEKVSERTHCFTWRIN